MNVVIHPAYSPAKLAGFPANGRQQSRIPAIYPAKLAGSGGGFRSGECHATVLATKRRKRRSGSPGMFLNWRESADSRIISAVAFEGLDPPPDWVMDFRLGDSLLMTEIENALISV